ncbi:MAG TPA: hypothetical protein VFJ43_17940, partial [Bacteroidia bacterium]|nr:hypothetical protein [Bacteroidia bacterium]
MSWVLLLLYTFIIFYSIYKLKFFQLEGSGKWTPSLFFLLKIFAGVALYIIYTKYYTDRSTSDIWKYFDDSKVMYDALPSHPGDYFKMLIGIGDSAPEIEMKYYHTMLHWYRLFDNNLLNDAHIVIRFNALVRLISMGNYFTHSLIMCFLSFIGLTCIYKTVYPAIKEWRGAAGAILFLLPSLVFWSSGVMKEGIMLFGLGVLIYQTFQFFKEKKWWRIIFLLIGATLLLFSKFYVIVGVIPPLIAAILVFKNRKNAVLKFLLVFVLFFFAGYSVRWFAPEREPLRLLANKQNEFLKTAHGGIVLLSDSVEAYFPPDKRADVIRVRDSVYHIRKGASYYYRTYKPDFGDSVFVANSNDSADYKIQTDIPLAGSMLNADYLKPNIQSFIKETPRALVHTLFRPFIWEGKNPMLLLPALENLMLLILLALTLFYRKKISNPEIFGFCFTFSILLFLVMGLTTPVLGALVRYRIVAQPFFLIALLMLID